MKVRVLFRFLFLPLRPGSGLPALLENPKRMGYAILIFLTLGILYTFSVQLAYMKGIGAAVEPFIRIPADEYYRWQRYWQIPFFFMTSILFAGTIRLLAITAGGRGRFEDTFVILCIAQTFPMFLTMWLPETILFLFFPDTTIQPDWLDVSRQAAGIVWPLAVTVYGVSLHERISWYHSLLFTLIAALPMTALMVIFIR